MRLPPWLHLLWQKIRAAMKLSPAPLYTGIDVSEYNNVDLQAMKDEIDFAILRCGYGSDYGYQDDSSFVRNVQACQKAKIPYGVYLFSYAKNETMAKSEADHVIRLIKGTDPAFGVWYDVEDLGYLGRETLVKVCKTWCEAVLKAGITCVGLYASLSLMENELKSEELDKYEKWVAQWNSTCDYPDPGIWQFESGDDSNGTGLDRDYAYKNYPDITGANMTQDVFNKMLGNYFSALEKKPVDSWAAEAWDEACEKGLFDGTGPQSALTREQAAMVIPRMEKE